MPGMNVLDLLERKRDGRALSPGDIQDFIAGVVSGGVTRAQAAAMMTSIFIHGMTEAEIVSLTLAMRDSGEVLAWPGIDGVFADKHSTGGVGDKVSLILAPLWAELGARVPMISGRGLGHTGGTLDKLEAIPGFSVSLPQARLHSILADVGCFICGQTATLAPADRILYALRNETATVPSPALITASILSKKLAEGIDELVLDVKWGTGAFNKTREAGEALAERLTTVGNGAGVKTRAILSEMNQPLGEAVGNALEVTEALRCLRGDGPEDLSALVCALIDDPRATDLLASGAALERFRRMVRAQGGDPDAPLRGGRCEERLIRASHSGTVSRCDAYTIGRAAFVMGAGRARATDPIHYGTGVRVLRKIGDTVQEGEPLAILVHADQAVSEATQLVQSAYTIQE